MAETRCKHCNCLCHCSVVSQSDMLGICPCQMCKCDSQGVTVDETKECETCQQIQKKCCGTHSKEKEDNGECCQSEEKENATALTFENETSAYKNKEDHE